MSAVIAFYNKLHSQTFSYENLSQIYSSLLDEWHWTPVYPQDESLAAEIEAMFHSIDLNQLSHQPIVTGTTLFDRVLNDYRTISSLIDVAQLKALPLGYGGRAGVILHTKGDYIFNLSNRGLMSDFGGGVRAKNTPYYGLMKELSEECPQWMDYILEQIDTNPEVKIHCVETFHKYDEQKTKKQARFCIEIVVPFDESLLSDFCVTKEVKELVKVKKTEIHTFLSTNRINSGLSHLQDHNLYV
jgi:hypothetical protein